MQNIVVEVIEAEVKATVDQNEGHPDPHDSLTTLALFVETYLVYLALFRLKVIANDVL